MFRPYLLTFILTFILSFACSTGRAQDFFERVSVPPGGRIDAIGVTAAQTPLAMSTSNIWRYDRASGSWMLVQRFTSMSVNTKRIVTGPGGEVYAVTMGQGLWRSTDDGRTWEQLVTADPYTTDVLPLASGELYATTHGRGVLFSTDNGTSWEQRNEGLTDKFLRAIVRDASGNLYGGHNSLAISKSTDDGMTWNELAGSPTRIEDLLSTSDGSLYSAGQGAVYRSTDNGVNWQETSGGPGGTIARLVETADGGVFAMRYSGGNGIYRYDTGTDTWAELPDAADAGYGRGLAIADDGTLYSATVKGVWYTGDLGQSWTEMNSGIYAMGVMGMVEAADGTYLIATNYQGLLRSTDKGATWNSSSTGLTTIEFYSITADPAGDVYAGGRYGEVFRSTDSGLSWTRQNEGHNVLSLRALTYASTGTLFAAGRDGVLSSTDKGVSWSVLDNGIAEVQANIVRESPAGIVYAGMEGSGAYLSTDDGASWQALHQDLATARVKDVAVHGNKLYLAASGEAVFGSHDNGATWQSYSRGGVSSWVDILEFTEDGALFAGHAYAVSLLNPMSEEWIALAPGFHYVKTLTVLDDGHLYVGSLADGLYRTTEMLSTQLPAAPILIMPVNNAENTGTEPTFTWTEQSDAIYYHIQISRDAMHQDVVWEVSFPAAASITIDPNQLETNAGYHWRLAAGNGAGHGPWSETWSFQTGMSTGVNSSSSPDENTFTLTSSPNPFTSSTQLLATLPQRGHVRLHIIDMLGRTVAQLTDGTLESGAHQFTFSAVSLPAGYYTAVLESGGRITAHRMLLVR